MASLIKQYQVQGLVALQTLVDELNKQYPASKVTTNIVQTPESSPGAGDAVNYSAEALLAEVKQNIDSILDGSNGLSLPELKRLIDKLNAELNGGSYKDTKDVTQTLDGFKNKVMNDVVRIEFTATSGVTAATPVNAALITSELTTGQSLTAYTADGAPIVQADGTANPFDFDAKTFAAAPYIVDMDASRDSGDPTQATGGTGTLVYKAFAGQFKVFPVGSWTLETLPANALLDNSELQLIAYDQALQKLVLELAKDKALIDRIVIAVGDTAIADAVANSTAKIDTRIDRLEGTEDSDLSKVAVKVDRITGKPAEGTVGDPGYVAAETVDKTTMIASKAYIDAVDNAIKADIGEITDTTSFDANGDVAHSTVRGELNSIEAKMLRKDALVSSVKESSTVTDPDTGVVTKVTSDENTINETALVDKFKDIDSKAASLKNAFETFRDTTAPKTYVDNAHVIDTFTKIIPVSGVYTDSYTDVDNKEVVGKKVFNEEISKIKDDQAAASDVAYKRAGIVTATAVTANTAKGITAKTAEDAANIDSDSIPVDNIPVYSQKAVDNKVDSIKEEVDKAIADLDDQTYDWSQITVDDGLAINGTVTKTSFDASTGAESDTSSTEILVAAGTAETQTDTTTVLSAQLTRKEISALKAELEGEQAADKLELKNRIQYGDAVEARARAAAIELLSAASDTTVAPAALGQPAIVATADGPIKQLQDTRIPYTNIQTSDGIATVIMDTTTELQAVVAAEPAATISTKVASKQYVDDAVKVAVANASKALREANRDMDNRVDAIEATRSTVETVTPAITASSETLTLSHTPSVTDSVIVVINGISYYLDEGAFTISGDVITWDATAAGFSLDDVVTAGDSIKVHYTYTDTIKVTPIA